MLTRIFLPAICGSDLHMVRSRPFPVRFMFAVVANATM